MTTTQVNLKTKGDIKNFQIFKSVSDGNPIDNWELAIEATKNEINQYELELNKQKIIIFNNAKKISEDEKIYAQDIDDSNNQFIIKSLFKNLFFMNQRDIYFKNNGNYYNLSSVPSGTKGDIYPIKINNRPVAVFCQSNTQINGNFQMTLYTIDNQIVDEIVALFLMSYISLSPDFVDLGIFSVKKTLFYSFSGRKNLTKSHLNMLPKNSRPLKIEAGLWMIIGLLLIIGVTFIKPIMGITIVSVWVILFTITFIKNLKNSKES